MILIVVGAVIGYLIGRLPGLLVGAALGYFAGRALQQSVLGKLRVLQSELLETTFAVMGAICKADRVVTRDEIKVAEALFGRLHLSTPQREAAKAAFNRGKAPEFDLDAAVDRFARVGRGRGPILQLFLQIQCMAVAADGNVHPAEREMLVRVARRLGLGERDVAQLEALLRTAAAGAQAPGANRERRLADAYAALGLSSDASDADVKRAYRRLMSRNHPDKLAAKGLPESMREIAEERTREINGAYDVIKAARGFV